MKVWNYVVISLVMMIFLTFLGFNIGGFTQLFNLVGLSYIPSTGEIANVTISASSFSDALFGTGGIKGLLIVLAAAGGAVIVGLFAKTSGENLILLPFITGTLVLFLECFISLINYSIGSYPSWVTGIIVIIFLPLSIGYIVAMAEFFRGTD